MNTTEHHVELIDLKKDLEKISKRLDKLLTHSKISQEKYDIFKGMVIESLKELTIDIDNVAKQKI